MGKFDKEKLIKATQVVIENSELMAFVSMAEDFQSLPTAKAFIKGQSKAITELGESVKFLLELYQHSIDVNEELNHTIKLNKIINDAGIKHN